MCTTDKFQKELDSIMDWDSLCRRKSSTPTEDSFFRGQERASANSRQKTMCISESGKKAKGLG